MLKPIFPTSLHFSCIFISISWKVQCFLSDIHSQSTEVCLQIYLSVWPYLPNSETYSCKLLLVCYIIHHVAILKIVFKILRNKVCFWHSFKTHKNCFSIKNCLVRHVFKPHFYFVYAILSLVCKWCIGQLIEIKLIKIKLFYSNIKYCQNNFQKVIYFSQNSTIVYSLIFWKKKVF